MTPPPAARRRSLVPERLLLPPPPREPELARRFSRLPFEQRRRLALASVDPASGERPAGGGDAELVRALARARVATAWRLHVAALVLGWLVLMTVWGFGRSTFPQDAGAWRAAGLATGGAVWLAAAVAARRRVRHAAAVARVGGRGR